MNILCLIILVTGGFNWASIGLLQYDFIAGFFGTQASIFSRLFYIVFGFSAIWMVILFIKNKGNINFLQKKSKQKQAEISNANNDILS